MKRYTTLAATSKRTATLCLGLHMFLASFAQARMAPAFAKEIIADANAIVIATPAGNPYKVRIKRVLYTSAPIANPIITVSHSPIKVPQPCYSFAGIERTTILFLKRPKAGSLKWDMVSYHHDWIPLASDRVRFSTYTQFDTQSGKDISVRILGNGLMFTDSFKPKDWRFATVAELCAELKRLADIVHAKRPSKATSSR